MARTVTSKELGSRTARRSLPIGTVDWMPLSQGRTLGYRKGSKGVSGWRATMIAGFRKEEKLAIGR